MAAALARLQTQLPRITKELTARVKSERTGAQYSYTYADLAAVSQAVLPLLGGLGLSFTARPTLREDGRFVLAYELAHTSGESKGGEYPLPDPGRVTPQEIGGHITYARRYCLCAVTGAAPDDDDDDAAVAERAAQRREQRRQTASQRHSGPRQAPMTGEQQRQIQKLYTAAGITSRDEKLELAIATVNRQVRTASELTADEAAKVIAVLQARADKKAREAEIDPEAWLETQQPPEVTS